MSASIGMNWDATVHVNLFTWMSANHIKFNEALGKCTLGFPGYGFYQTTAYEVTSTSVILIGNCLCKTQVPN